MMITPFLNDAKKSVDWKGLDVDGWTVTETDDENTRAREMRRGKKKDTGMDQLTTAMAMMAEAQLQFQQLHQQSMLQQQQQQQLQQHQQQQFQQQLQRQQIEMME